MDKSFIRGLRTDLKKHMYSSGMRDSTIGNIEEWITSDLHDFNRICSGDLNKCLPAGRVMCVAGPEGSGKTMIILNLIAHAQKMGYHPIAFETEGAWDNDFVSNWGVDPDNLTYNYVVRVEDLIVGLEKLKEKCAAYMKKHDGEFPKLMIALDSLGNLDTYKKETDAGKNTAKLDQGLLARWLKSLFKTMKEVATLYHIPVVFSNHLVGNPGSMSPVEDIVGGKAPKLQSDIIGVLYNKGLREGGEKTGTIIGSDVTVTTRKNRFFPPFQKGKIEINFSEGVNKYAGIVDVAIDLGFFVRSQTEDPKTKKMKEGKKYVFASDPEGPKYWSHELFNESLFTPEFIEEINKKIQTVGYSTVMSGEDDSEDE